MLSLRRPWRLFLPSAFVCSLVFSPSLSSVHAQTARPKAAQSATPQITSTLSGTVVDPTGAVIPGAAVTFTRAGSTAPLTATSDAQGNFTVSGLAPGSWTVTASAPGFRSVRVDRVTLLPGQARRLTLTLIIEIQQQQVTVNANAIDSSPDKNGDAIIFKGSDLDALSDEPDELTEELQAIAGSDPDAGTNFYIDGFSGGRLPPKSAIREIRMNQNPYSAQYDQVGFGRIEIFTKPGADTWHADLWTQANDSSFNSRNPFVITQPPYNSLELWGDLNGPLTKHSSEFTEFWHEGSSDDSIVNAFVLDPSFDQVPFTQIFPNNRGESDFSTRYDLQAGNIHTLTARYHLSQETATNGGVGQFALASQAFDSNQTEQSLQLSDSQTWSPKFLNETRFQYIRDRNRQTPQNFGPTIVVQGGFTGGGNNTGVNNDAQDHYELQNYAQTTRGKHTIAFGARLRDTRDSNYSTANFNGQYTFSSLTAYQITEQGIANGSTPAQIAAAGGGASLFSQTTGTPAIAVNIFDAGLYAEDNDKIRPNVTLTYGLRFESQTGMPDHADFAPRFGASWAINGAKNKPPIAVIRSGFGLFYQRFQSLNVLNAERQNGITEQQQIVTDPAFYPAVCSTTPADCSGATSLAPTIFRISPTLHAPYIMVSSIGVDKPIGHIGQISVNYQLSRGDHLFLTRNINAPLPGTFNPADPTSGVRPLGTDQNIYEYESEGDSVRHRIFVNANIHTKRVGVYSNYQFGEAHADTSGIGNFPSNGYDLHQDWGRASNDYRNRLFFGGWWHIWRGFQLNPFLIYQSSAPFNIVVGQDLNGDNQFNDRPTFATDLTRPSVVTTPWGTFDTEPIAGQTTIPINYGTGPDTFVLNMRVMKNFNFGKPLPQETPAPAPAGSNATASAKSAKKPPIERKYTLGFGVQAQNVLNHVNLAPPVGVLGSPLFGQSTALASNFGTGSANRTINLSMSFHF
jgi:Carboxypeptidase regulatory-like domain